MAFGDLKGTLVGSGGSIATSNDLTGSVAVVADDLVVVAFTQQANLHTTGVTDNLGNTYTALNAGSDAGGVTGIAFYSLVTNAGTLTTVTVAASAAGANDYAGVAAVIEGAFDATPLDANPANITNDVTSPFTCPATGTLAQADEVIFAWGSAGIASGGSNAWAATSPNLLATNASTANVVCAVGYQVVAATTSVAPEFTAAVNPANNDVLGTASFKKAAGSGGVTGTAAQTLPNPTQAASGTETITGTVAQTLAKVTQSLAGTSVLDATGTVAQTLPKPTQSASGTMTLTVSGSAAQMLPRPTQAAVGTSILDATGTIVQILPSVRQSIAGTGGDAPASPDRRPNVTFGLGPAGKQRVHQWPSFSKTAA